MLISSNETRKVFERIKAHYADMQGFTIMPTSPEDAPTLTAESKYAVNYNAGDIILNAHNALGSSWIVRGHRDNNLVQNQPFRCDQMLSKLARYLSTQNRRSIWR